MTLRQIGAVVVCAFALTISAAEAKQRHHVPRAESVGLAYCASDGSYRSGCAAREARSVGRARVSAGYAGEGATVIGGRPSGCPPAYCGCAAARFLGLSDPRLNLAWNWTKYYHGPTPVAVWRHHVAIIERMTGPHTAVLRDYNSGRGLSRIHERSIAGARIVGRTSFASAQ